MEKTQIASVLQEMSVLLELTGANPFKSRAFANGARTLENLDEDLSTLIEEDRLLSVKGIGKGIAAAITELVQEGRFSDRDALKDSIPDGVFGMLSIPGLGAKKVRVLHEKLGVDGLDALEAAANAGQLRDLAGFGARSEAKILEGIEHLRQYAGRSLWPHARAVAAEFEAVLADLPEVRQLEIAGSLRRRSETVRDVDLLVAVDEADRATVMDAFVSGPAVTRVLARGATKSSIVTAGGVQVDLRAVADDEFPYALHHFTGSKDHNTALRGRAKSLGLKMSEWGVFRGDERLAARNETEVFAHLGLPWIAPELREDRGEIEAAEAGELPELVTDADVKGVLHVHTTASDGRDTLEAMVAAAREHGWEFLGISDHSVSAAYANGLDVDRIREQHAAIDALQKKTKGLRILKGIESDILGDGALDYDDDVLDTFDFVVASVHSRFGMSREGMTDRILTAIRHPAVSILGHPTGRLLLSREPYDVDLERVMEEAGRLGVAVELNANPHRLDLDWRLARKAIDRGVTISIGPDAHRTEGLDDTAIGVGIARKGWLEPGHLLNCCSARSVESFGRKRRQNWKPRAGDRTRWDAAGETIDRGDS